MAFSLQKFPLFRGQTNLACDHLGGMKSPTYLRIELPLPKSPFILRSFLTRHLRKKKRAAGGEPVARRVNVMMGWVSP